MNFSSVVVFLLVCFEFGQSSVWPHLGNSAEREASPVTGEHAYPPGSVPLKVNSYFGYQKK